MSRALTLMFCFALGACGTVTRVEVHEKAVPVAVACVPANLPWDEPVFPDSDAALKAVQEPGDALLLLGQGRLLRQNALDMAWGVIAQCRKAAPLPDSANAVIP